MEYQCLDDFTEELKDKISNINEQRKAFFSRSSDDLYSDFNIQRIEAKRSINANPEKRGKLTELLITNRTNIEYVGAI